ncbi:MAG: cytochrome c [Candidatus Eisenbacteria bacterium]|nr:cytochrome c [Candidatus Eisenbacteria bacterium]
MKRSRASLVMVICVLAAASAFAAFGEELKPPVGYGIGRAPTDSASVAAGAKIYATNCVPCHGKAGHGDGPTGVALKPRPRDFASPKEFKSKNDDEVFLVVSKGGPVLKLSAGMPPWGGMLNKAQIWQVIAYVRGFPARDSLAKAHATK